MKEELRQLWKEYTQELIEKHPTPTEEDWVRQPNIDGFWVWLVIGSLPK